MLRASAESLNPGDHDVAFDVGHNHMFFASGVEGKHTLKHCRAYPAFGAEYSHHSSVTQVR